MIITKHYQRPYKRPATDTTEEFRIIQAIVKADKHKDSVRLKHILILKKTSFTT